MPHQNTNNLRRNRGGPYKTEPATDLTKWRLSSEKGRQIWTYFEKVEDAPRKEQTIYEKHFVGLDISAEAPPLPKAETPVAVKENGLDFFFKLQTEHGHWAGDYGGPLFLMPSVIIVQYICRAGFPEAKRLEMIRYIKSVTCPDGGWGLHIEGPPTAFGCAMNYCAMRLLGVPPNDPVLSKARDVLHKLGGAAAAPQWGKFFLSVLNVYSWDGMNSLFPELWITPEWLPFHPSKMWSHLRQVYLPMAYCYGRKIKCPEDELIRSLRRELYVDDYYKMDWPAQRNNVSAADLYMPHSWVLHVAFGVLNIYEKVHIGFIRKRALEVMYDHVAIDDSNTTCVSIGPVSKSINMLIRYYEDGPMNKWFIEHTERVHDYLWLGLDGMKVQGINGSQLWDLAFISQGLMEAGAQKYKKYEKGLKAAHNFLKFTQIPEDCPEHKKYYREKNKGGFPFSTRDYNWIVSDCTGEGLKAVMDLEEHCQLDQSVATDMMCHGADVLLELQSDNKGWGSYERQRAGAGLELLNASEIFRDIMVDYPHVECTSSSMKGLARFNKIYPYYRSVEIRTALKGGIDFMTSLQRPDGSWEGLWGVCFTYGAFFALEAYACTGLTYENMDTLPQAVKKGCRYLISKQMEDGGWGENFESCEEREYVHSETSQIINTSWALLALMTVRYPDVGVLEKGIRVLMKRQLPNGDWPQENVSGAFARTAAITYTCYRNIYPLWALGRFINLYPENGLLKLLK